MSKSNSEVMYLSLQHLYQMEMEFIVCFQDLFESAFRRLRNAWVIKLEAIKQCSQIQVAHNKMKETIVPGSSKPEHENFEGTMDHISSEFRDSEDDEDDNDIGIKLRDKKNTVHFDIQLYDLDVLDQESD